MHVADRERSARRLELRERLAVGMRREREAVDRGGGRRGRCDERAGQV
jgi:hypothetical protein